MLCDTDEPGLVSPFTIPFPAYEVPALRQAGQVGWPGFLARGMAQNSLSLDLATGHIEIYRIWD